jgi:hypothetical protein
MEIEEVDEDRARGKRSEEVAEWYFRLNGFFLIPGFIVHPDTPKPYARTEADLLGIRLKDSSEGVWRSRTDRFRENTNRSSMEDDQILINPTKVGTVKKHLIAMVEVKSSTCDINGPWSDGAAHGDDILKSNMARALARVGFGNNSTVAAAAKSMYENLRYEGSDFAVQYFAIGKSKSPQLAQRYAKLVQISFDQIAEFLGNRFYTFPEKIPLDCNISLWEGFGDSFSRWYSESRSMNRSPPSVQACQKALKKYIDDGNCK